MTAVEPAAIVRALIVNDGAVLVLRNSQDDTSHPGCWEVPGGWVEDGESLQEALRREVREETGLEPAAIERRERIDVGDDDIATCRFFRVQVPERSVALSAEHDAARWIDPLEYHTLEHHYYSRAAIPAVERLAGAF